MNKTLEREDLALNQSELVCEDAGMLGDTRLRPLYFGGRCFYVRKTLTGTQVGDSVRDRQIGGIYLTDDSIDQSNWVEVLAIGPKVGQRIDKEHAKNHKRSRRIHLDIDINIGDLLLCPDDHPFGIKISPIAKGIEWYIEESVPRAIMRRNDYDGSSTAIEPFGDRILVEPIEEITEMDGIFIPDSAVEKPLKGSVLDIGGGLMDSDGNKIPCNVEIGDQILFSKETITDIFIEKKKYYIVRMDELMAIVG